MASNIHPSAVIDPKAEIGDGVTIGPFCVVEAHSSVGAGCVLEPHVVIKHHVRMGANNHIHSFACIGDDAQHLKYNGEETWVEIGEGNVIREYVTVHRGTAIGHSVTSIGSKCMLMAYSHVAHDCRLGNEVIMANSANLGGHVDIGDFATVGGLAAVHQFVRVGDYAFIGGMSGIGLDVPPYMITQGIPAKLHGPNVIGLKRRGFTEEVITAIRRAYKLVWRSRGAGKTRATLLAEAEGLYGHLPQVKMMLDFCHGSKRGVMAGAQEETPA